MENYVIEHIVGGEGATLRIISLVICALLIIWVAVDIVTHKRKPINWLWMIVLLFGNPLAGSALYFLFTRKLASNTYGT